MPLVEYVGNATPQDNTEVIQLGPAEDGTPRSIRRGGRALLSATELRSAAANYQVRVVADAPGVTEDDQVPTKMPDGYDEDGYKEGESPTEVVFTPEAYPDPDSEEAPASAPPAPVVPPSPPGPASPGAGAPSTTPASPGASG